MKINIYIMKNDLYYKSSVGKGINHWVRDKSEAHKFRSLESAIKKAENCNILNFEFAIEVDKRK